MSYPTWWPDWAGQDMLLVASGPSAASVPLDMAEGSVRTIAINTSIRLAPWADILYACDNAWWKQYKGWPGFSGLRLSVDKRAAEWGAAVMKCRKPDDRCLMDELGEVGWGGNSGFHALNLAIQMRPKKVFLVGYDLSLSNGKHWHANHPVPMHNPKDRNVARWRNAIDAAAKVAQANGVEILNCSAASALVNYRKVRLEDALEMSDA